MTDQTFELHPNLKIKLTPELILETCREIETAKIAKYVTKFPGSPRTFQWSVGESEWLARKVVDGRQYGLFLSGSSRDTINLHLVDDENYCVIWDIGYDGRWIWRWNPNIKVDLDHWWNKCRNKIHLLEDVLNESTEPEFEPVLD